jgi:hypothetical protein
MCGTDGRLDAVLTGMRDQAEPKLKRILHWPGSAQAKSGSGRAH